jgi:hypothetical protein
LQPLHLFEAVTTLELLTDVKKMKYVADNGKSIVVMWEQKDWDKILWACNIIH